MPFTIDDWGDHLKSSGRRKDHFTTFPNCPELTDIIALSYAPPGPPLEIPYFGRPILQPWQSEWEIEVIEDNDFKYRDYFERWCNSINCGTFKTEIAKVEKRAKTGEVIETVETPPLVPIYISSIECCWDCNDTLERFTVRFLVNPLPFDAIEELP